MKSWLRFEDIYIYIYIDRWGERIWSVIAVHVLWVRESVEWSRSFEGWLVRFFFFLLLDSKIRNMGYVQEGDCVKERECLEFVEILLINNRRFVFFFFFKLPLFYLSFFQDFTVHSSPFFSNSFPIHSCMRVFILSLSKEEEEEEEEEKSRIQLWPNSIHVSITKRLLNLPNSLPINPCFLSTFTRFNTLLLLLFFIL